MTDFKKDITNYFEEEIAAIKAIDLDEVNSAVNAILDAYNREATIYVFGNGGSAATASHMVCDFNKGICSELDKKFHMICLNDNIPMMMAIANDFSYDDVFAYPLIGNIKEGDIILAISGSGNSKNVIKAVEYGKSHGAIIVGVSGYNGGKLYKLSDYNLHAPIDDMMKSEDIHMIFDHLMMTLLKRLLNKNGER